MSVRIRVILVTRDILRISYAQVFIRSFWVRIFHCRRTMQIENEVTNRPKAGPSISNASGPNVMSLKWAVLVIHVYLIAAADHVLKCWLYLFKFSKLDLSGLNPIHLLAANSVMNTLTLDFKCIIINHIYEDNCICIHA